MHKNSYRDRGIIKWSSFDSLCGHHALIDELKYRLNKRHKPLLSIDQYEVLNQRLKQAIAQNHGIEVSYFESGFYKFIFGTIKKIDWVKKIIVMNSLGELDASKIIEIKIIYP